LIGKKFGLRRIGYISRFFVVLFLTLADEREKLFLISIQSDALRKPNRTDTDNSTESEWQDIHNI